MSQTTPSAMYSLPMMWRHVRKGEILMTLARTKPDEFEFRELGVMLAPDLGVRCEVRDASYLRLNSG